MRRHEARLRTETEARLQTARESRREAAAEEERRAERRRAQTTAANTATYAGQAVRTRDEHMSTVTVQRGSHSSGGRDRSDLHEMIQEEEAFLRERAAEEERVREEEREAEQRQQRLEEERVREEDRRRQRLEELGRVREEAHARAQQRRAEREELERAQAERMVAEARAQAELESQAEAEDDEDSSASDMSVVDSDDDSEDGDDDDDGGEAMTRRFSTVMGAESWQVGQIVQYNSSSNGGWVYARIEQLHDDGRISLDVRRSADPARIRRPVGGGGAHAAPAARDGLYRAGDPVSVFSRTMVSRHNIAAIWVAFFSRRQRYRCAQVPKKLAIVGGQASLAAAAKARLYAPDNYYSWIFGLLTAYDKPDAVAAVLSLPQKVEVLVLSPVDELLKPLEAAAARSEYAFATSVGGSRITVEAGPAPTDDGALAAISKWFAHRGLRAKVVIAGVCSPFNRRGKEGME